MEKRSQSFFYNSPGTLEREMRGPLLLQLTTPTFSASVLDATSTKSSIMTPRPVIAVPAPLTLIRLDGFVMYTPGTLERGTRVQFLR